MFDLDQPIDAQELDELISTFGEAPVQHFDIEIDRNLYENRFMKSADRRGEVVFAIQMPEGILLHRKSFYDGGVFRLPSGGIDFGERVIDALHREIREETNLSVSSARFLGVQDCRLRYNEDSVRFVSYIFHVQARGTLRTDPKERIVELQFVSPAELRAVAESLRRTPFPNAGWGRWRSLAHDLVYQKLVGEQVSNDQGRVL